MTLRIRLFVGLIAVAPLFATGAKAMTLENFGRMNNDDEATYVALLVESSASMLKAQGKPDQASQVLAFFRVPGENGGVYKFASHMKAVDALNKRNEINPNNRAPLYQVEDAMAATLKEQNIIVPAKDLIAAGKQFHAEGPPRQNSYGF